MCEEKWGFFNIKFYKKRKLIMIFIHVQSNDVEKLDDGFFKIIE